MGIYLGKAFLLDNEQMKTSGQVQIGKKKQMKMDVMKGMETVRYHYLPPFATIECQNFSKMISK